MQVFRTLAGYSLGRADIVRRAMSKKKHSVLENERAFFCDGCAKNGIDKQVANEIFDDMTSFASYAFNKSHAAAYAVVAYRTAYLKCYYPCEFMASLLTSVLDNAVKVSAYIEDCKRMGIKIFAPNVNYSQKNFTADTNNGKSIVFGLLAIKNLGHDYIDTIIREREMNGSYNSFYSFCKRTYGKGFNRRAVESLIKSGALDNLGNNRREMLTNLPFIVDELDNSRRRNLEGQIGFFDIVSDDNADSAYNMKNCSEFALQDLLAMEKETTGLYISSHPMNEYTELAQKLKCDKIIDLLNEDNGFDSKFSDGSSVKVMGIITNITKKQTKNGEYMAFFTVEDVLGSIEIIAFPKIYAKLAVKLSVGTVVLVGGRLSSREDESSKIILDFFETADNVKLNTSKRSGLFLRFSDNNSELYNNCVAYLKQNAIEGDTPLYYYFCDSKKYFPCKKISVSEKFISDLKSIIGDKNVILQK